MPKKINPGEVVGAAIGYVLAISVLGVVVILAVALFKGLVGLFF